MISTGTKKPRNVIPGLAYSLQSLLLFQEKFDYGYLNIWFVNG